MACASWLSIVACSTPTPLANRSFLKLLDEIELVFHKMISKLNCVAEIQISFVLLVVSRPLWQTWTVGIAGCSEVDPIARHRIRELLINIGQKRIRLVQIVEDVSYLTRVVRSQIFASRVRRHVAEEIQVSFRSSVRNHSGPRSHLQGERHVPQVSQI